MKQTQLQIQYDFFRENHDCEMEAMGRMVINTVKKECESQRRAMWNRYTEQSRMIQEILRRVETVERNICKGL